MYCAGSFTSGLSTRSLEIPIICIGVKTNPRVNPLMSKQAPIHHGLSRIQEASSVLYGIRADLFYCRQEDGRRTPAVEIRSCQAARSHDPAFQYPYRALLSVYNPFYSSPNKTLHKGGDGFWLRPRRRQRRNIGNISSWLRHGLSQKTRRTMQGFVGGGINCDVLRI